MSTKQSAVITNLASTRPDPAGCPLMLTGNQIAAARRMVGMKSQSDLAAKSGVSLPTIARAEAAKDALPAMGVDAMAKIVQALEAAGAEFHIDKGNSLAGGIGMGLRK